MLHPIDSNEVIMKKRGSYQVKAKCNVNDYQINFRGESKTYHINLLKKQQQKANVGDKDLLVAVNRDSTVEGGAVLERFCPAIIENDKSFSSDDRIKTVKC